MTTEAFRNQCIAMAAIIQAAHIADEIAVTGQYSEKHMKASANSIFSLDTSNLTEIYPDLSELKLGLQNLISIFNDGNTYTKSRVVRYTFAIIQLQLILKKDSIMLMQIHEKLRIDDEPAIDVAENLLNRCFRAAEIYSTTLSKLRFKIYISGDRDFIGKNNNEKIIRAMLLAGVRAAFLWHQFGGRRWKLFFQRRKMVEVARNLSKNQALV